MPLVKKNREKSPGRGAHDNFDTIILETRRNMSSYRRFFSQLIHIKVVSSISDFVGSTIARPNALLFGGICSFAFTLVVYLTSKNLGYSLSGLESMLSFAVGWAIGILFDVFTAKRKN